MSAPKLRDLQAERGLLGSALLCERRVDQEHVLGLLPAAGYFSEAHREVHAVLSARCAEGQTWGTMELVTWAVQSSQLDRLGGLDLLTTLADRAPTTLGAERLAGVLRELWARRQVVEHADRLRELAGDTAVPWDRVDSTLTAPPQSPLAVHGGRWQTALDVAALFEADVAQAMDRGQGMAAEAVPSGIPDLDERVKLARGQVAVIAGRPGMGKSVLALQWAVAAAHRTLQVVYVSMEMPARQLFGRFCSMRGMPIDRFAHRPPTRHEAAELRRIADEWRSMGIVVDDRGGESVDRLCQSVRELHRRQAVDVLVIDHLGLLNVAGRSRYEGITHASGRILALTHELGCATLVLSQLSRAHAGRSDGRPRLSDLRDSGAVEQDANVVIGVYRPSADDPEGHAFGADELHVMKNREGVAPIVVQVEFDGAGQVFRPFRGQFDDEG